MRKEIVKTDSDLTLLWNSVFAHLFAPKPPRDPNDIIEAEKMLTDKINAAGTDVTLGQIGLDTRKALEAKGIKFTIKEMLKMTKEIAEKIKPSMIPPTSTGTVAQKNSDIKPNEDFDKPAVTENPTGPEPGKEETTSSNTKAEVIDTTEEIIEFKDLAELENHLRYQYALTKKYSALLSEAVKYFITLNEIPDAKDWDLAKVETYLKQLVKPVKAVEETKEVVAAIPEVAPTNEMGEPAATVIETAAPVATVEAVVPEKKKENTDSAKTSFKPGFKGIHEAQNRKQYETAVLEAFVNNKGDATDHTELLGEIVSTLRTPGGGKYVQGIWRNKEEEQLKQIKKIVGLNEIPQTT